MNYLKLRQLPKQERARIAGNIARLREHLISTIPRQTTDKSLVLGTWNIRNFDDNRFGHGHRLDESIFYISEIISAFDTLAIQEITANMDGFERLKDTVGEDYDFILTDATEGRSGNSERLGFAFNRRKVTFAGIAGEIVLPQKLLISSKTKKLQFSRTPFCCLFEAGWFKFMFSTVHIYYGAKSKKSAEYQRRVGEIRSIANFLKKRADNEESSYILVGDFNIDKPEGDDAAFNALEKAGFGVFKNREGSNKKKNKYYDQISFRSKSGKVELAVDTYGDTEPHGVFDLFESVFRDKDFEEYDADVKKSLANRIEKLRSALQKTTSVRKTASLEKSIASAKETKRTKANRKKYYLNEWRTFQMSDHLPLWVALKIDFTEDFLEQISQ